MPDTRPDWSEHLGGPALVAVRGADAPDSELRLGTREYDWHRHQRGQLLCIDSGLAHVRTAHGSWLLPPHRAGWIPPRQEHQVSISGVPGGWSILLSPAASGALPSQPCVIAVGELLRALVVRAAAWPRPDRLRPEQKRLIAVLLDEVRRAPREPLHLPMPADRRLLRIAGALLDHPGDNRTLEHWSAAAGLSPRTARRLFQAETGMSFNRWREQARLIQALERLARGERVATVADALGYATPSNFIAMFRRNLGDSPARYFARASRGGAP